jgi:LysR family transcriptional activator of glutamate synthase operon
VELRQLQYFLKVAKKQHVTRAAEELHVAQSAVSRQIRQLEEELGVKLFVQKGRNVQLSPVGKLFLRHVEQILNDLERAVQDVREFMDPEAGEIRLGFPHSLGVNLVPRIVSQFHKDDHPKVMFRFKQGKFNVLIDAVLKGEIDLALISPHIEHEQLRGQLLFTEELLAIIPPDHPLAENESIRLEQLKDESFVLFSEGYSLRNIVWDACLKAGFIPKIGFEGEETDTIRGLVGAGMGVSLLPEMALKDMQELRPAKVKITDPKVTRTVGLIYRADGRMPLVAEIFRRFLLDYFDRAEKAKEAEEDGIER